MSIQESASGVVLAERESSGFPELTPLGKRIEMLRIERGLSKQALARHAETSRQQLWRVMTGKSELTSTLGQRLADALQIDARILRGLSTHADASQTWSASATDGASVVFTPTPATLADFVADPRYLERALSALPADAPGARLRRALLDAVREATEAAGIPLDPTHLALREPHQAG